MDFVVREARAGDADALLRVQREASLSAFAHIFPAASAGEFPDEVIRRSWVAAVASPSAQVLVAERHGEVVGVVSLYPGDGLLARLFVVPRHWGRGSAAISTTLPSNACGRRRTPLRGSGCWRTITRLAGSTSAAAGASRARRG
jgi:hypothetical protein